MVFLLIHQSFVLGNCVNSFSKYIEFIHVRLVLGGLNCVILGIADSSNDLNTSIYHICTSMGHVMERLNVHSISEAFEVYL